MADVHDTAESPETHTADRPEPRLLAALGAHGRTSVCFQSLESHARVWIDGPSGLVVPYVDTGSAWLGIGAPLGPATSVGADAARFVAAARAQGRRVSFVAVEKPDGFPPHRRLVLGEQPIFVPRAWPETLAAKRSLREQLRRARAKGVSVRAVDASELAPGSTLRARVRELAVAWLDSRRMEPLQFLVALEPFHERGAHRYFVAEREGRVLAFASAIPIPARDGFLLEDLLRDDAVPNGTTELLFDALMRAVPDASMVTLGLAPLSGSGPGSGPMPPWMRGFRAAARPLYDFEGLRAFKERLGPSSWEPVYLVVPEGESMLAHLLELARALVGGSILRFAGRSLIRHPSGPPWALVTPLVVWIALRVAIAIAGGAVRFGSSPAVVLGSSLVELGLAALLFRAALRPSARRLAIATAVAGALALRGAVHVAGVGLGVAPIDMLLRAVLVIAPTFGAFALAWATRRRAALERGDHVAVALPHF